MDPNQHQEAAEKILGHVLDPDDPFVIHPAPSEALLVSGAMAHAFLAFAGHLAALVDRLDTQDRDGAGPPVFPKSRGATAAAVSGAELVVAIRNDGSVMVLKSRSGDPRTEAHLLSWAGQKRRDEVGS